MADTDPKLSKVTEPSAETEASKPTATATEGESKPAETAESASAGITTGAASAATAVKENVFSMFGGGPKREKKEEQEDDVNEPSGSSKAKKEEDVSKSVSISLTLERFLVYFLLPDVGQELLTLTLSYRKRRPKSTSPMSTLSLSFA